MKKANNWEISQKFLDFRSPKNPDFKKQKRIEFCETLLKEGFDMRLYEARKTSPKYITIYFKNKNFKVRFSDHKPIKSREKIGDCVFLLESLIFMFQQQKMQLKLFFYGKNL